MLSAGHAKPVTLLERGAVSTQLALKTGTAPTQERGVGGLGKKEHFKILGLSHEGQVGWGVGDVEVQGWVIGALEVASLDGKDRNEGE